MITWRMGARKRLLRCCLVGGAVVRVFGVGRGGLLGVIEILRYLRAR
jgi:hypothetical protein